MGIGVRRHRHMLKLRVVPTHVVPVPNKHICGNKGIYDPFRFSFPVLNEVDAPFAMDAGVALALQSRLPSHGCPPLTVSSCMRGSSLI